MVSESVAMPLLYTFTTADHASIRRVIQGQIVRVIKLPFGNFHLCYRGIPQRYLQ